MENVRSALKSQYHAALAMLREAIETCPDSIWIGGNPPRQFFRLAYHTLYFTHLYLEVHIDDFRAWDKHRDDVESDQERELLEPIPYSKDEILEYFNIVDGRIDSQIDKIDLNSQETGIPWYKIPKLDHVILNLRHVQEHAGQLRDRLMEAGFDQKWTSKG